MDASLRSRSVQHDKTETVIPSAFSCHSEPERGIQCVDNFGCAALSVFTSLAVLVAVLPERFQMARQSASTNWRFWS